ncbi:ABC transporter permease [Streptomyces bugieae]|uniref:ABC transporter permease n=1 Tax=Streptomyces bugieae TaxID=3098223 RepID=A0ABU7NJ18_9ACTN|nr:ABC transporter permease [Streptomyces sp. DSM 41528]
MRRHLALFATATRYHLVEHARNRFAMFLVVLYIPTWVTLCYANVPDKPTPYRLRDTGRILAPPGNELTQISGAINAVTLITGFMMFAATFAGGRFDRRLVMAGYPRTHLALAKITSLALASAAVAAYATAVMWPAWPSRQPLLLATVLFGDAMTYGALGVIFGSLLRREVEGMFAMLMTSVIDIALQSPLANSGVDSAFVRFLPSWSAMQAAVTAGFSDDSVSAYLMVQLAWFTTTALLALLAFHHRTRNALPKAVRSPTAPLPHHDTRTTARRAADPR